MAVAVHVKTNVKYVQKNIRNFQKRFPNEIKRTLLKSGFLLLTIIKELTKKGKSFKRRKFPKYSKGYEKWKREYSKSRASNVVDLMLTGRMMQSLTPDSTVKAKGKNRVELKFSNEDMRDRAFRIQTGQGNHPERPFFGFDKRTEKKINKEFEKEIGKRMKRMGI
jgi:phage gpG-like protein